MSVGCDHGAIHGATPEKGRDEVDVTLNLACVDGRDVVQLFTSQSDFPAAATVGLGQVSPKFDKRARLGHAMNNAAQFQNKTRAFLVGMRSARNPTPTRTRSNAACRTPTRSCEPQVSATNLGKWLQRRRPGKGDYPKLGE